MDGGGMPGGEVLGKVFPVGSGGCLWTSSKEAQGGETNGFLGVGCQSPTLCLGENGRELLKQGGIDRGVLASVQPFEPSGQNPKLQRGIAFRIESGDRDQSALEGGGIG